MKKDEKLVAGVFKEIFDDLLLNYKRKICDNNCNGKDAYAEISRVISSLDDNGKKAIFDFFKIVSVDTASIIFGTIDGVHFPPDIDNDFILLSDDDEIQGDLQDIFLARVQDTCGC
ncbi:hypothetical protein JHU04_001099 [Brenneria sp. 4F2]|nr:hypothetical protein [Brenneria bubanii]